MCFDDLKALVHQGGRIDGHLFPHLPARVPQGLLGGHIFESLDRIVEKGPSGGCQDDAVNVFSMVADHGLENGAVLAVDGKDVYPHTPRFLHHDFTAHDQGLFIRQSNVFFGLDRGKCGDQTDGPDKCRNDHIGLVQGGDLDQSLDTMNNFWRSG